MFICEAVCSMVDGGLTSFLLTNKGKKLHPQGFFLRDLAMETYVALSDVMKVLSRFEMTFNLKENHGWF